MVTQIAKAKINTTQGCVTCFNALGIDSRMRIYRFLKTSGASAATAIVKHVGLTQPTISYHLSEMKNAGVLASVRKGKEVMYEINDKCRIYDRNCVLSKVEFPN